MRAWSSKLLFYPASCVKLFITLKLSPECRGGGDEVEITRELPQERSHLLERPLEPTRKDSKSGGGSWCLGMCGSWGQFEVARSP